MRYQIRLWRESEPGSTWSWEIVDYNRPGLLMKIGVGGSGYATAAEAATDAEQALAGLMALSQGGAAAHIHAR